MQQRQLILKLSMYTDSQTGAVCKLILNCNLNFETKLHIYARQYLCTSVPYVKDQSELAAEKVATIGHSFSM